MSRWSQVCNSLCPCINPSSISLFMLVSKGQQADLQLNIPCLCFLFQGFEESCREHAPHAIFIRQTPHWFSCCLISAVARYFPTSKSPSPIPRLQLSPAPPCTNWGDFRDTVGRLDTFLNNSKCDFHSQKNLSKVYYRISLWRASKKKFFNVLLLFQFMK